MSKSTDNKIDGVPVRACVGCGFCCVQAMCDAARRLYPAATRACPELKWTGERHVCGLMTAPDPIGRRYRQELYAGAGCCSGLNSWRRQPLVDRTAAEQTPAHSQVPVMMQLFLSALGREFISGDAMLLTIFRFQAMLRAEGYSEDDVDALAKQCVHYFTQNRSTYSENFLG